MEAKKQSIVGEYFEYKKKFQQKYGEKVIILMQIGDFYETFSLQDTYQEFRHLADTMNLVLTRRNKNKITNTSTTNGQPGSISL